MHRGSARALFELLSSMRFAIALLTILSIASVIGTVVKQNDPLNAYLNQFGPFWFPIFETLGLYSVYNAGWFIVILAFLVLFDLAVHRAPDRADAARDAQLSRARTRGFAAPVRPPRRARAWRQHPRGHCPHRGLPAGKRIRQPQQPAQRRRARRRQTGQHRARGLLSGPRRNRADLYRRPDGRQPPAAPEDVAGRQAADRRQPAHRQHPRVVPPGAGQPQLSRRRSTSPKGAPPPSPSSQRATASSCRSCRSTSRSSASTSTTTKTACPSALPATSWSPTA